MAFQKVSSTIGSLFNKGETEIENADPKSAFAAVGKRSALGEINHPAKVTKFAATKDAAVRQPLAARSTNVALPAVHAAKKAVVAAPAPKAAAVLPPVVAAPASSAMDTMDDFAFEYPALEAGIEDIDKADAENPQLASEYTMEIYQYMRLLEVG